MLKLLFLKNVESTQDNASGAESCSSSVGDCKALVAAETTWSRGVGSISPTLFMLLSTGKEKSIVPISRPSARFTSFRQELFAFLVVY